MNHERRGLHRFRVHGPISRGIRVELSENQRRQIRKVLRLVSDDRIIVFDGKGMESVARLELSGRSEVAAEVVEEPYPGTVPGVPVIHLFLALIKGDRFDLAVQKATELGVSSITPIVTTRSVVRLSADRARSRLERWRTIAVEALEQSGRADDIEIREPLSFVEALEEVSDGARLIAWEGERDRVLARVLDESMASVALFVGPEGGFTEEEVALAIARGVQPVSLGPLILRAETAAIAVPGMIRAAFESHNT
jgi:16S rRNA (uracil1498-N3)-methyltransferase